MADESSKKRPAKEKGIPWLNSAAREILLTDLHTGALQLGTDDDNEEQILEDAIEAWDFYQQLPEFKDVPWCQFFSQIKSHRVTVRSKVEESCEQMAAFQHDQALYPRRDHYHDGQRIFRMTPAYRQLQKDVAEGLHRNMTPSALRALRPELYGSWDLSIFSQRIYQSERQWKFINYLEVKRAEKAHMEAMAKELESNFERDDGTRASKKARNELEGNMSV